MLLALDLAQKWYTPEAEEARQKADPEYIPAKFLLAPLSFRDREILQNLESGRMDPSSGRISLNGGSSVAHALRCGVKGWSGIVTAAGTEVAFKADPAPDAKASEESLTLIPGDLWQELYGAIRERSWLTVEARKN